MTATYTRKWLDSESFNSSCKDFVIWRGQMVFYDPGPLINDAQIIATSDGETFTSILDIDSAVAGIDVQGDLSGASLAVYDNNLFISQHSPNPGNASILEWDGTTLTQHLTTLTNYETHSLVAWANKLWILTDVTPGKVDNDRTVVYYDGTSWTTIIDYDGDVNFPLDKGAGVPQPDNVHRVTQLFLYANSLYIMSTHYSVGSGQWTWDVWKIAVSSGVFEFNLIATVDADYVFSSVINFEGTVYVTANTISAGGVLQNAAKTYTSTNMTTWTLQATIASLGVPFGEKIFNQKFFLNALNISDSKTQVWYLDRFAGDFILDATISTNTSVNQSGQLQVFGDKLYVGKWKEVYVRGGGGDDDGDEDEEFVVIKIIWKDPDGNIIFRHYAPIDVRSPDIFYDGRILTISNINRAIDDKTGLYIVGKVTVSLANNDKEFSKLLATYFVKNQLIEVYHGWQDQPHGNLQLITRMIVEDYSIHGPVFKLTCKDVSQAHFKKKIPFYITTEDEFPNIHPDETDMPVPEILGLNSITTGDAPGAVEALYTDTTAFEYLAAYRTLESITHVYSAGALKTTPTNYSVVYRDGHTFIDFTTNQGDKKITFNCTGYSVLGWDSTNDYVQNPAYIILFYLNQITEVPAVSIDYDSFDELAQLYEGLGVGESGKLTLDTLRNPEDVLKEMLFSFGCVLFMDNSGRFVIKRKDISNFATSTYIFEQIDLLKPADRTYGLKNTVNHAKTSWDYYTAPAFFKGTKEVSKAESVDDFEADMEAKSPWKFPWMITESFVDTLIEERFLKYAYGDKKLKFSIPIQWIDDIDVFDNFRYQDPWGISASGVGESGRYYYVESLKYDLQTGKIDVVAIDLQWLLQQYFILGDRDSIAANWSGASQADKLYGYLADRTDSDLFADGVAGKILIDRNVLG